jgi:hypothetical protein
MVFEQGEAPVTRNFRLALIGCCALAGIALLVEFGMPLLAPSPESLESTRARDEQAAAKKADAMAAEILKRPLFSEGRTAPQPRIAKALPPEPPKLQGRLAGVVLQSDFKEALFTRPGGKPMAVKEGQVIDGWTVGKIEEDRVTLTSAFGQQVVKPTNGAPEEINAPAARPVAKRAAPAKIVPQRPPQMPPQIPGRPPMSPPLPAKKAELPSTMRLAPAGPEMGSRPS